MLKSNAVRILVQAGLAIGLLLPSVVAQAHAERAAFFPNERVDSRPSYRPLLPTPQARRLVVCKKPGNEGVAAGDDSASRIARMGQGPLKSVNEQLYGECGFQHLQAAVDAVTTRGTTIYVLPGLYREQPSIQALEQNFGAAKAQDRDFCQAVLGRGPGKLSYEEQYRCRFIQNTVAIFGDPDFVDDACGDGSSNGVCAAPQTHRCLSGACQYYDLQIEGTGAQISDVIFEGDFVDKPGDAADGHFRYLNGIRADRADGIYFRNFTTQIYEFNAVYVMETDGYVFDRLLSRWVDEYAFLSFASDHGLYDYTEGYGVADSVQYPGSGADVYPNANHASADLRARQATEVRNSKGHHSALGYSGTAGNAPWVHNNEFYKNQTGMATESVFGGHPGMPQDHALWENNLIYSNNKDYYRLVEEGGPCVAKTPRDRGVVPAEFRHFDQLPADVQEAIMDRTVVCPPIPFPTGTAMIIAGGNYDVVTRNQVFDNWRQGLWLLSIPTLVHQISGEEPESDPAGVTQPFFTAHYNRVLENHFGENPLQGGRAQPNGVDLWWDNSGVGNCFVGNTSKQGTVTSDLGPLGVQGLPTDCPDGNDPDLINQVTTVRPDRITHFATCLNYNREDPASKQGCPFFDPIAAPGGREGSARVTAANPAQARSASSAALQAGYFVLHNDTSMTHRLKKATLRAHGPVARLGSLSLSVKDIRGDVVSATGELSGDTLVFTFQDSPAVEPQTAALFELGPAAGSSARAPRGAGLMLAGLGSLGGMLLFMGGLRRRERAWLFAALAVTTLLASCSGRSDSAAGAVGEAVQFTLTSLEFEDAASGPYAGLPLAIGEARLP